MIKKAAPNRQETTAGQQGFTIIELMIATAVFSTMLVMVSVMMVGVTRLYYKGISQSQVQGATRNIVEQVSQSLQFTDRVPLYGTKPYGPVLAEAYCMNNVRYSFVRGVRLGSGAGESRHVLWRDTNNPVGTVCEPLDVTSDLNGGSELAIAGSRLADFRISPLASPYGINVILAYGEDDLFTGAGAGIRCKGETGGQFCATSKLNVTSIRRITEY